VKEILKWLAVLCLLVIFAQSVSAKWCSIHVYDLNHDIIEDAFIKVWKDNDMIDSGTTDKEGIYMANLDEGTFYRITASGKNRFGDWNGFGGSDSIDIIAR